MYSTKHNVQKICTLNFGLNSLMDSNGIKIEDEPPDDEKHGIFVYAVNSGKKLRIVKETYDYLDRETVHLKHEEMEISKKDVYNLKDLKYKIELYERGPYEKENGITIKAEKEKDKIILTKEIFNYKGFTPVILRTEKIKLSKKNISKLEEILER